jgi:hypothetical protein
MSQDVMLYILKRDEVASFDKAVPLLSHWSSPQRLLCSGRIIKRIEIIFPIRLAEPVPFLRVYNSDRSKEEIIDFVAESTPPSRSIFSANVSIVLDNKFLEFSMTRDCCVALYFE